GAREAPHKDDAGGRNGRDGPVRTERPGGAALIVVGPRLPRSAGEPEVWIPTATPGLSAAGLVTRSDGVSVVLKALGAPRLPTEDDVLDRLAVRLAAGAPSRRVRRAAQPPSLGRRG